MNYIANTFCDKAVQKCILYRYIQRWTDGWWLIVVCERKQKTRVVSASLLYSLPTSLCASLNRFLSPYLFCYFAPSLRFLAYGHLCHNLSLRPTQNRSSEGRSICTGWSSWDATMWTFAEEISKCMRADEDGRRPRKDLNNWWMVATVYGFKNHMM